MTPMRPTKITREQAKALVDNAQFGTLVIGELRPVPVIGTVEEREKEPHVDSFQFGDWPDERRADDG